MYANRKVTRAWLTFANKTPFYNVLEEAKLTPEEQGIIIDRFVKGKSIVEISLEYSLSKETVQNKIKIAYEKIGSVLSNLI